MGVLEGFVHKIVLMKEIGFLELRPLYVLKESVIPKRVVVKDTALLKELKDLTPESYVTVDCQETLSPSGTPQHLLLKVLRTNPTAVQPPYALNKTLDYQNLDRDNYNNFILRRTWDFQKIQAVRTLCQKYTYDHFVSRGCCVIDAPKLVQDSSEGGSEVFTVGYGDRTLSLAQSPQLYKQYMINSGFRKVFDLNPIYRAEKHNTTKHSGQAMCVDYQMATQSTEQLMSQLRDYLIGMSRVLNSHFRDLPVYQAQDFCTIKYDRALELLNSQELGSSQQKALVELMGKPFVFVTGYPEALRPFYAKGDTGFDLLCPFSELASGSLRVYDPEELSGKLPASLRNTPYHNSFMYGTVSHGGWGFGLDRFLTYYLGLSNIKKSKFHKFL